MICAVGRQRASSSRPLRTKEPPRRANPGGSLSYGQASNTRQIPQQAHRFKPFVFSEEHDYADRPVLPSPDFPVSARSAQAAEQADPDRNVQFRRWPVTEATGPQDGTMRTWYAADVAPPMSRARRLAEARWAKVASPVQRREVTS